MEWPVPAGAARTVPIPKDVRDVETLVKDGLDPTVIAVYISVQNITSVFAECVSVLPELEPYYDVIAAAEEEYMPSGPPMSPLTRQLLHDLGLLRFPVRRRTGNHRDVPPGCQ